jgi:glycosyltransferase involved in cell wall biosynthesis
MRIAQVAPLHESVPPKYYGGTERVVSYLTEALVGLGHDVTLFASGDSVSNARLVACCERSLRMDRTCRDPLAPHMLMIERVFQNAGRFDVIHFHIGHVHLPLARRCGVPCLTTLHGRLDLPEIHPLFREFADHPLVSISEAQREPLAELNWLGTVHHGLPGDLYTFRPRPGNYLAFLGRVSPEKRLDRAIAIAKRVGVPLKVAAKVDAADEDYFCQVIRPLLDHPLVEFIGEIGELEKDAFLGNAQAFLFPIDWPEPFGLVMIESMACGTPVIAYPGGSVEEVVEDGVNGFLVRSVEEGAAAVRRISALSRARCRASFEERFSSVRMAQDYIDLYRTLIELNGDVPAEDSELTWKASSALRTGIIS